MLTRRWSKCAGTKMKIIDADQIAQEEGVCRRTALSRGSIVYLGNKAYIKSSRHGTPVRGKHKTLQQVADMLGCSRSTVLRVIERTGLGVQIGNRRYVPESQIRAIKKNVLSRGVTRLHADPIALRENCRKMAQARWGKES